MVIHDLYAQDILTVATFIGWHESDHVMGGRTAHDAMAAFARLVRVDAADLLAIVRGTTPQEDPWRS